MPAKVLPAIYFFFFNKKYSPCVISTDVDARSLMYCKRVFSGMFVFFYNECDR